MSVAHLQRIRKIGNLAPQICCWAIQLGGPFFAVSRAFSSPLRGKGQQRAEARLFLFRGGAGAAKLLTKDEASHQLPKATRLPERTRVD
jgi:hypothetical protein